MIDRVFDINRHRGLAWIAIVLGVILLALLVYLFFGRFLSLAPAADVAPQAGLEADLVINGPGKGSNPKFDRPLGAAFGKDGRIYVADSGNNRVVVFDKAGKYLFDFGTFGVAKPAPGAKATWRPGSLNFPVGLDVDASNGDVYVADFYNDSVSVFDAEGTFKRRFPDPALPVGKGSSGQDGRGIAATDVCVTADKVYVTDQFQIFVFDKKGRLIEQFGRPGTAEGELDHPNGIVVAPGGRIYVADSNNNRVQAFESTGAARWVTGAPQGPSDKVADTPFNVPRGIGILTDGSLLVTDAMQQAIVKLSPAGKVLASYGSRGTQPAQLNFPNSIDVSGESLLVADKENNRVQVLRLVDQQ